jgi:SAM domain (Sterile alpha motif)
MDGFYAALSKFLRTESNPMQMELVRKAFDVHGIEFKILYRLTSQKLAECGIKQVGLREAILAVLGK